MSTIEAELRHMGWLFPRETVDVEQWIVPAETEPKSIQIGWSNKDLLGKRVLLLLSRPGSPTPSDRYHATCVIDLEDANNAARELEALNSPWIPHVSTTTSYPLFDWESHPFKVPTVDPRILEVERILKEASRQTGGR